MVNLWSVTLSILAGFLIYKFITRKKNLPPGPRGWPLIGIVLEFKNSIKIHLDLDRFTKKYGDVYSCYMGRQLVVMLNSSDMIKEAFLTNGDDFSERANAGWNFTGLHDALMTQPFNSEWKQNKKFTIQALKNMGFGTIKSEEKIVNEIEVLLKYIADQKGAPFQTKEPVENTSTNTLLSVLLNERHLWGSNELKAVIKNGELFMESLGEMFTLTFINQYVPRFMMKIICAKQIKQCKDKSGSLLKYISQKVKEHKATLDVGNSRDLIDMFLEAGKDKEWSFDSMVTTISVFFPDGGGTVGDAINWVILYSTHHPDEQKALQKQIDEVCGGRPPTLDDRKQLTRVEAFITETFRMANLAAMSGPRVPIKNTTLRGYDIPRNGVHVFANFYSAHMNPKDFPDPEKFKPSRFLDKDMKLVNTEKVLPFAVGSRMCVGSQYSKSVIFLNVSHLFQRFTFKFPEDQPNPSLISDEYLVMRPQLYKVQATQR